MSSSARLPAHVHTHTLGSTVTDQPTILLGTTSAGKIREYRELLAGIGARIVEPSELGISIEVEEGDQSFEDNARAKALAYWQASGLVTFAEDSGFEVDALDGEPGVISARWGDTDDYAIKNRLILERLKGVPTEQRRCRYVAHVTVIDVPGHVAHTVGVCEGRVAEEPAGSGGFGYDPIFFVPEYGKTLAQMTTAEKGRISHRGEAARTMTSYLRHILGIPQPEL
jgi:XTP/dITP diphosphohydrolase